MGEEGLADLREGSVFHDRYHVVGRLKSGGMGAVYEVIDSRLERRRALKLMLPEMVADPDMRARFELEAKATARVHSEHVVETIDVGVDLETGAPFMVMELLQGEDLHAVLRRRGALPASEALTLLHQTALALDRVHAVNVVHRDLKPANLFLTKRDDGSPRLKVLDFGIAKMVLGTAQRAATTRAMGTPAYMSPEQIRGDGSIGPRADLYALGHIAYALLTGRPYWWQEESDGVMWSLVSKVMLGQGEPATVRGQALGVTLPAAFDPWFARATAIAPEDRFGTAAEMVESLAAALGTGPGRPAEPRVKQEVKPEAEPRTVPLGAAPAAQPSTPLPASPLTVPVSAGPISVATPAWTIPEAPRPRQRWKGPLAGALVLGGLIAAVVTQVSRKPPEGSPMSAASVEPPAPASAPISPGPVVQLEAEAAAPSGGAPEPGPAAPAAPAAPATPAATSTGARAKAAVAPRPLPPVSPAVSRSTALPKSAAAPPPGSTYDPAGQR